MPSTGRGGFSSITTLAGAQRLNMGSMQLAQADIGGKIAFLISSINLLNVAVAALQSGAVSAANSGVTWSAFSTAPSSMLGTISNF